MRIVSNLIDRRRVWRSLPSYPVYSPPFRDAEAVISRREAEANYDYFLREKPARLGHLSRFLKAFSIELKLTAEGLPPLDSWLHRYGGHLVPAGGEVISALMTYEPGWVGVYHGLNVVNDLGIYAGDYIIAGNKDARWDLWYGDGGSRDYEKIGFQQPCLFGLRHSGYANPVSMLYWMYSCCQAGRLRLNRRRHSVHQHWDIPGEFVRRLTYLADPDPPPPKPFSQIIMDD